MYCTNCGKELEAGAHFCTYCGSPAETSQTNTQAVQDSSSSIQQPTGKQDGKKTIVLVAVIAVLAGLLAALLAFTMCSSQQTESASSQDGVDSSEVSPSSSAVPTSSSIDMSSSSTSSSPTSSSADTSSSQDEDPEELLTPEDAAIKSLDGWWAGWYHRPGYYAAYGNIHDKVIDWYYYNPDIDAVEYASTVEILRADQFDENGAKGWRFFPSTATNESFAYYQAEGDEDSLPIYKTAFGYGNIDTQHNNTDAVERFGITRIIDPATLDEDGMHSQKGLEQAQALAKERGVETDEASASDKAGNSSAASSSEHASFDQAKAEAEARSQAEAAGKQILTGRVIIKDENTRTQELGLGATPSAGRNPTYIFLQLSTPITVTARNADGATNRQEPYRTHDGIESVLLGTDNSYGDTFTPWEKYEGQEITIACSQDEIWWFSDATGALFNVRAAQAEVIAPLTEEDAKAKEAANSPDAYVLADSATKTYSRAELEALDNHTLFLARNEIYARHGRGFKNQELRDYFASKAWYKETASPESFNENALNETEKANANLMLDIEKSRNSPYLG